MSAQATEILATKRLPNGNIQIIVPIKLTGKHSGNGLRIIVPDSGKPDTSCEAFLLAVARGRRWQTLIDEESVKDMKEIAEKIGVDVSYVARLIRIAHVSPLIIEKAIAGKLPGGISLKFGRTLIPVLWEDQIKMLQK